MALSEVNACSENTARCSRCTCGLCCSCIDALSSSRPVLHYLSRRLTIISSPFPSRAHRKYPTNSFLYTDPTNSVVLIDHEWTARTTTATTTSSRRAPRCGWTVRAAVLVTLELLARALERTGSQTALARALQLKVGGTQAVPRRELCGRVLRKLDAVWDFGATYASATAQTHGHDAHHKPGPGPYLTLTISTHATYSTSAHALSALQRYTHERAERELAQRWHRVRAARRSGRMGG